MPDGDSTTTPRPTQQQRGVPLVNMNRGVLDDARGLAHRHPDYRSKQFTGLAGEVGARDFMKREYGKRAQELLVPLRSERVPILDLVYEIGKGEYVVIEAKGSVDAPKDKGPSLGKTNDRVFQGRPSGRVGAVTVYNTVEQSSPRWFEQRLAELRKHGGPPGQRLANRLEHAWNNGKLRSLVVYAPTTKHTTELVQILDRTEEWNRHRGVRSTLTNPVRGPIAPITDPARLLAAGTSDVSRGLQAAEKAEGAAKPLVRGASGGGHAVQGLERAAVGGARARALVIGVQGWRAVRTIGKIVVLCFVPLKVLDVAFEIALAIWDRVRKKEEKKRKVKELALKAVFKESNKLQKVIERDIVTNQTVQEDFLRRWDNNRQFLGFMYARIMAEIDVEYFTNVTLEEVDEPRNHKIVGLTAYVTDAAFGFELVDMSERKELAITEQDKQLLKSQNWGNPDGAHKFVQRRRLRYTIVPPLLTPFDTVVTKINNLFLDTVHFIGQFSRFGEGQLASFGGFDYRYTYAEQFGIQIDFPAPLNAAVCDYCLAYLHWAAKKLSQHPLTREDLSGDLEDPVRGWKRRRVLLNHLLEKEGSKHGKNFSYLASQMPRLVKSRNADPLIKEALDDLYVGARMIWHDLERIERNLSEPDYYYMGGEYKPPKR